jgi:L-aminopeptidase/D-esterase-like protein
VNQWWNPRKSESRSNLVDRGGAAAHAGLASAGAATSKPVKTAGGKAIRECLRRTCGEAAGEKLGAAPVDRHTVNMGTAVGLPFLPSIRGGSGQAHRRLMVPQRGGAAVVVVGVTSHRGGRESRPQGKGQQQVRSWRAGRPGEHR